jgi:DNA-directed RNA polymerase subunit RPC12/RpoP
MNSDDAAYILVVCPACRARLHPRRELGGKRVRCPDCGVAVRVPTEAQVAKAARRMPASVGEYRVADEGVTTVDQPECFLLRCPTCGARLHPRLDLVGKRVRCPDCERPVLVTAPREPTPVKERPAPGVYGVGATPIDRPPVNVDLLRSSGTLEPVPLAPPPPRLWFYTGVFSFPWRQESIARWLILSLWALVTGAVTTYAIVALPIFQRGFNFDQGSAIMSMLVVWLGSTLWAFTLYYASNCVFSVIRDTAFGNDMVADWGDADLTEGIWRLLFLVAPFLVAGSLGFAAMWLTALVWPVGADHAALDHRQRLGPGAVHLDGAARRGHVLAGVALVLFRVGPAHRRMDRAGRGWHHILWDLRGAGHRAAGSGFSADSGAVIGPSGLARRQCA